MKTISRYLTRQIFGGLVLAAIVLLPLFAFMDLLEQLEDVGEGTYEVKDAFIYVALLLPRRLIQLAPFIALLGNVVALGRLAMHHELISLRAAGLSPARISLESLRVGLILVVMMGLLEQFVAPPLQQEAILKRSAALEQSTELGRDLGIWSRDKSNILRVGRMPHTNRALDIEILRFDSAGRMKNYIHAEWADILEKDRWLLRRVTVKQIDGQSVVSGQRTSMNWKPFLDAGQIETLTKPPESLSPTELIRHVRFLRATGQEAEAYSLAMWRKLGAALTTIAMILLSVPFVFGSVRTGLGARLVLAGLSGIAVYLLDQIIANAGLLLNVNTAVTALLPGTLLICLAVILVRRVA